MLHRVLHLRTIVPNFSIKYATTVLQSYLCKAGIQGWKSWCQSCSKDREEMTGTRVTEELFTHQTTYHGLTTVDDVLV